MIGAEFTGVMHAAQQGRVAAFTRLWADLHPVLVRYLRVVTVADADDVACESWVTVVRRLNAFEGDETAWRALVFSAARMHAEDENQRRVWDAMVESDATTAVVAALQPPGEEPYEDDELEGGPAHRLRMAIEAIRDLPPEQGEVLMLRVLGLLPEASVAEVVGADVVTVHLAEQQALDQLGVDAELVSWALSADPRPVELADEAAVLTIYRSAVPEQGAATRSAMPVPHASRSEGSAGAKVITLPKPTWRTRAGVSAAATVALVGVGALSAAAFQGVLPDRVQTVMHNVIGAPLPDGATETSTSTTERAGAAATSGRRGGAVGPSARQTSLTGPAGAASSAAVGLCQAWEADRGQRVAQERSAAFQSLVVAAGGEDRVVAYCTAVGHPGATPTSTPTTTTSKPASTAKPTTAAPTSTQKPTTPPATNTKPAKPTKTKPARSPRTTTTTTAPVEGSTDAPAPSETSTTESTGAAPETGGDSGAKDSRGGGTAATPTGGSAVGKGSRG